MATLETPPTEFEIPSAMIEAGAAALRDSYDVATPVNDLDFGTAMILARAVLVAAASSLSKTSTETL